MLFVAKKLIMSKLNIEKWLSDFIETAKKHDFKNHIDLISKNISTYGMPGGKTLNYDDWKTRRKNELQSGLLKNLRYDKLCIKNIGLSRLIFKIEEIMDSLDGDHVVIHKNIILEQESDNKWRMVEESIKDWKVLNINNLT